MRSLARAQAGSSRAGGVHVVHCSGGTYDLRRHAQASGMFALPRSAAHCCVLRRFASLLLYFFDTAGGAVGAVMSALLVGVDARWVSCP